MHWKRFIIVLLLATLLNAGNLLNSVSVGSMNIRPDLLLILLVFFSSNCGTYDAIIVSFAIGFAADISSAAMGPYIISFGMFGAFLSQMRKVIIMRKPAHVGLAIFFTGILACGFARLLMSVKTGLVLPNAISVIIGTSIYSGIVGSLLGYFFSVLSDWLGVKQKYLGRSSDR